MSNVASHGITERRGSRRLARSSVTQVSIVPKLFATRRYTSDYRVRRGISPGWEGTVVIYREGRTCGERNGAFRNRRLHEFYVFVRSFLSFRSVTDAKQSRSIAQDDEQE